MGPGTRWEDGPCVVGAELVEAELGPLPGVAERLAYCGAG